MSEDNPLVEEAARLQREYEDYRREYQKALIEAGIVQPPKEKTPE